MTLQRRVLDPSSKCERHARHGEASVKQSRGPLMRGFCIAVAAILLFGTVGVGSAQAGGDHNTGFERDFALLTAASLVTIGHLVLHDTPKVQVVGYHHYRDHKHGSRHHEHVRHAHHRGPVHHRIAKHDDHRRIIIKQPRRVHRPDFRVSQYEGRQDRRDRRDGRQKGDDHRSKDRRR